ASASASGCRLRMGPTLLRSWMSLWGPEASRWGSPCLRPYIFRTTSRRGRSASGLHLGGSPGSFDPVRRLVGERRQRPTRGALKQRANVEAARDLQRLIPASEVTSMPDEQDRIQKLVRDALGPEYLALRVDTVRFEEDLGDIASRVHAELRNELSGEKTAID